MSVREATHAGSWYENQRNILDKQLSSWLDAVSEGAIPEPPRSVVDVHEIQSKSNDTRALLPLPVPGCKAIISPHAGYSYSGPAAAWAFKCIDPTRYNRVFILGPSHHVYLDGCALSTCETYQTPIGALPLDLDTIQELRGKGAFSKDMKLSTDEDEHSIEMQLPYIRKVFAKQDIKIVPILVGSISTSKEEKFGELLAPYLADQRTLFVVSSDFCHWGSRFSYTYYKPEADEKTPSRSLSAYDKIVSSEPPIHASIRALDGTAISHLTFPGQLSIPDARAFSASQSFHLDASSGQATRSASDAQKEFASYLRQTRNTICGRHPIGVLLGALVALEKQGTKHELRFTRYEQSSQCVSARDSSVSYASAFVRELS